ncbi:hypothetical protein GBA52_001086 [Prunus armeniaca]|nr:hypothetical protein GBA52_001086 [Prunus armeniaca]
MAFASALNTPKGLHCLTLPSSRNERPPTSLILPRQFPARFSSTLALARRRNQRTEVASSKPKINKKILAKKEVKDEEDEDVDEDAIDALFRLLEEDLKNDDASGTGIVDDEEDEDEDEDEEDDDDDDDEDDEDDDDDVVIEIDAQEEEVDDDDDDDEEEEEEEESPVKLKTWQLRRLAAALKVGRRKPA